MHATGAWGTMATAQPCWALLCRWYLRVPACDVYTILEQVHGNTCAIGVAPSLPPTHKADACISDLVDIEALSLSTSSTSTSTAGIQKISSKLGQLRLRSDRGRM